MPESVPLPRRRSVRLKSFDYSQPAAYFVTVCARDRKSLFGQIVLGKALLNVLGDIVNECWREIPVHFPGVELPIHVVMPNHLHGVLVFHTRARHAVPLQIDLGAASLASDVEAFGTPRERSIPTVVRSFKAAVTKRARQVLRRPNLEVWQRGYYEHLIRDHEDFQNTWDYIRWNPQRWEFDEENMRRSNRLP